MATYGSVAIPKGYVLKMVKAFHLKYQEMKTINNFLQIVNKEWIYQTDEKT